VILYLHPWDATLKESRLGVGSVNEAAGLHHVRHQYRGALGAIIRNRYTPIDNSDQIVARKVVSNWSGLEDFRKVALDRYSMNLNEYSTVSKFSDHKNSEWNRLLFYNNFSFPIVKNENVSSVAVHYDSVMTCVLLSMGMAVAPGQPVDTLAPLTESSRFKPYLCGHRLPTERLTSGKGGGEERKQNPRCHTSTPNSVQPI
jgi:hypothetical protein